MPTITFVGIHGLIRIVYRIDSGVVIAVVVVKFSFTGRLFVGVPLVLLNSLGFIVVPIVVVVIGNDRTGNHQRARHACFPVTQHRAVVNVFAGFLN